MVTTFGGKDDKNPNHQISLLPSRHSIWLLLGLASIGRKDRLIFERSKGKIMTRTFTCAMCGHIGECRPEEETEAELKAEFGDVNKEDCVIVCDDCWEKVRPRNNPEMLEAWKAQLETENDR